MKQKALYWTAWCSSSLTVLIFTLSSIGFLEIVGGDGGNIFGWHPGFVHHLALCVTALLAVFQAFAYTWYVVTEKEIKFFWLAFWVYLVCEAAVLSISWNPIQVEDEISLILVERWLLAAQNCVFGSFVLMVGDDLFGTRKVTGISLLLVGIAALMKQDDMYSALYLVAIVTFCVFFFRSAKSIGSDTKPTSGVDPEWMERDEDILPSIQLIGEGGALGRLIKPAGIAAFSRPVGFFALFVLYGIADIFWGKSLPAAVKVWSMTAISVASCLALIVLGFLLSVSTGKKSLILWLGIFSLGVLTDNIFYFGMKESNINSSWLILGINLTTVGAVVSAISIFQLPIEVLRSKTLLGATLLLWAIAQAGGLQGLHLVADVVFWIAVGRFLLREARRQGGAAEAA